MLGRTIKVLLAASVLIGCAGIEVAPSTTSKRGDKARVQTVPVKTLNFVGRYANADGSVTVTNSDDARGFQFHLQLHTPDACEGVDYSGRAIFSDIHTARSDDDDLFTFGEKTVKLEPAISQIGMSCARVLNVEFTK
jgi:hypothetical protein